MDREQLTEIGSTAHERIEVYYAASLGLHLLPSLHGNRSHQSVQRHVIVMALDSGFSTALLLLDFSAAFDCVDQSILLKVLQLQFGVTASALQGISSFFSLRSQSVKLSGSSSKIFCSF